MPRTPWMSVRDCEIISAILKGMKKPTLVEYGSGWSTVTFQSLVGRLITVETNNEWADMISPFLAKNVTLIRCPSVTYMTYTLLPFGEVKPPADVVFLDGQHRDHIAGYLLEQKFAKVVIMHDGHRESKNIPKYPYSAKIGDDLLLGAWTRPAFMDTIKNIEERKVTDLSYPWDPIHVGDPAFFREAARP